AAAQLGADLHIHTVFVGADLPGAAALIVDTDGHVPGTNGRLAVADAAAVEQVIDSLTTPALATSTIGPPPPPPRLPPTGQAPQTRPTAPQTTTAQTTTVRARVLGRPAILDTEDAPIKGLRAKSLELFVYLVVHRHGAALDDIMEALWPDVTVSRAAERLSTCVANLRTTIRTIATGDAQHRGRVEPVVNTGSRYHLDPDLLSVDWWSVQDAVAAAQAAPDDTARLPHLLAAVDAAAGAPELAATTDYEWADTDREHARRTLISVHARAAALHPDLDVSRALWEAACRLDPLSDDLARHAIRAAARLGDADGVRQRLTTLRSALADAELPTDDDTEHLVTTLLQQLPDAAPDDSRDPT
ncbi:hypothetical protein AB0M20_32040, partial [Actinoplanes sp. NPDC051633]